MPGQAEENQAQESHDEKCWHGAGPGCSTRVVREWFWGVVVWANRMGRGGIEKAVTLNSFTGTNSRLGFRMPRSLGRCCR